MALSDVSPEYRIVSKADWLDGRRYFVQIRRWWLPVWLPISFADCGFASKRKAETFAVEHASGSREEAMLGQWYGRADKISPLDHSIGEDRQ